METSHRENASDNLKSEEYGRESNADRDLSEKFGYNQVFERRFGYFSSFSFAFSVSGLFATVATTFECSKVFPSMFSTRLLICLADPLYGGGAPSAVWCWLISGFGCMCIAVLLPTLFSVLCST